MVRSHSENDALATFERRHSLETELLSRVTRDDVGRRAKILITAPPGNESRASERGMNSRPRSGGISRIFEPISSISDPQQ